MTRMTRPDCAVMGNLINTHTHTHTHRHARSLCRVWSEILVTNSTDHPLGGTNVSSRMPIKKRRQGRIACVACFVGSALGVYARWSKMGAGD